MSKNVALPSPNHVRYTCRHGVSHYGESFCAPCLQSAMTNEGRGMRGKDKKPRKRRTAL